MCFGIHSAEGEERLMPAFTAPSVSRWQQCQDACRGGTQSAGGAHREGVLFQALLLELAGTLLRQRQMSISDPSPGRRPEGRSAGRNPGHIP